jgi:tRNA wybutosine-synthesizing protein 1
LKKKMISLEIGVAILLIFVSTIFVVLRRCRRERQRVADIQAVGEQLPFADDDVAVDDKGEETEDKVKEPRQSKAERRQNRVRKLQECDQDGDDDKKQKVVIVFGTESGVSEHYAKDIASRIRESAKLTSRLHVRVADAMNVEGDDLCYGQADGTLLICVFSTHKGGKPASTASRFFEHFADEAMQPRAGNLLRGVRFAVFGLGNSLYKEHYNVVGRALHKILAKLGADALLPLGEGDEVDDASASFDRWLSTLMRVLGRASAPVSVRDRHDQTVRRLAESRAQFAKAAAGRHNVESDSDEDGEPLLDLEDMGAAALAKPASLNGAASIDFDDDGDGDGGDDLQNIVEAGGAAAADGALPQMLSDRQAKILTKQGYKVIGSHSAVKLCRWTKSMMRGRGGCYKNTAYGIISSNCMEHTPALACASKCTFCWRHHSNPVGTEWRWQMDEPDVIVAQAIEKHTQMIKAMRGVPGVLPERFEQAMRVRHCALSLVGEPIMYPKINVLLDDLHSRGISTFLVTNAQFPQSMRDLRPCTQLYISVDAPTRAQLKAIDNPLFDDFWERMLECMDVLREKRQRTVYRLTLVKGANADNVQGYCDLIERGQPDFVEVKGVTFCGGKRPVIGMKEVPWHEEVVAFGRQLEELLDHRYRIAVEHEHSCFILLARTDRFLIDNRWHTWIDFDRFVELDRTGEPFTSQDYMAPTPEWACFGSDERGFDPAQTRFRRKHAAKADDNYVGGGC